MLSLPIVFQTCDLVVNGITKEADGICREVLDQRMVSWCLVSSLTELGGTWRTAHYATPCPASASPTYRRYTSNPSS